MAKKTRKYGIGGVVANYSPPQQAGSLTGGSWMGTPGMIFKDGGMLDSKIQKLEGKTLYFFEMGRKEPTDMQIVKAELDPAVFDKRGLKLTMRNGGVEMIAAEKVEPFLKGNAIEMKDSKEYYLISLKKKYNLGGIVQQYTSARLLPFGNPNVIDPMTGFPDTFGEGGKIGFEGLSKKVARRYKGKAVPSQYQSEYGEKYDAEEAKEVGDKVAAKVYRQQQGKKMAKGGTLEKAERDAKKLSKTYGKIYVMKREAGGQEGEYVTVTEEDLFDELNSPYKSSFVQLYGYGKKFGNGGYTKRFPKDMLYKIREKQMHERMHTEGVGNFELPKDRSTRYLYKLDEFDEELVKGIKLKPNEVILRFETEASKIGKYTPLVKINLQNQMVYFLTDEALEGGDIKFERKGVKAKFINISDMYASGGQAPTYIENKDKSYDESMYSGILSDFDLDGLPNADDPHPFKGEDTQSVEQMKFSKTFKNILDTKKDLDEDLNIFIDKLKQNAPSDSRIYGRTKTPFSILNKLVSSRLLDEKKGLKDLVGTTVAFENFEDLEDFVKQTKKGLYGKVLDFDDYYADPKDGYRAFHFIIEQDGVPIELQLKTYRMKDINILSHDAYKNKTLNKDYMLYLTTLADHADKGNKTAQNEFAQLMSRKAQVEKQLNN